MWEELSQVSTKDAISYAIYALAYFTSIIAFSMSSMYWLRILTILSSACYVVYYYIYPASPLWLDIIAEGVFVLVNIAMFAVLIRQKSKLIFTEEEKLLHQTYFASLSPFDFIKLMRIAHWKTLDAGYKFAEQGKTVTHLTFIYDGKADIIGNDKKVAEVITGSFVGEISFKLKQPANATVLSQKNTHIIQWPQDKLHEFLDKNPGMKNCFEGLISTDLAMKLTPSMRL